MRIRKTAAVAAAVMLALATGSALAGQSNFPQTSAQIHADLENPHNTTYVPYWK